MGRLQDEFSCIKKILPFSIVKLKTRSFVVGIQTLDKDNALLRVICSLAVRGPPKSFVILLHHFLFLFVWSHFLCLIPAIQGFALDVGFPLIG